MKTIETTVEIGDDHMLHADLRANSTLEKGTYRAVIVLEETADKTVSENNTTEENTKKPLIRKFGTAKGKIWVADDFDETPEDFKDYM
jgi:hypothetical protein